MKNRVWTIIGLIVLAAIMAVLPACRGAAPVEPIVIGSPLALAYVEGYVPQKGISLAVEEINAQGGVLGRPLAVEFSDTRDLEPGVPVAETLLAVEKLILEKKVDVMVGGPVRSEAYMASMELFSKYKIVSIVSTGTYSPKVTAMIKKNYDKYKYSFRAHGSVLIAIRDINEIAKMLVDKYGFDKVFIMVQDVAHARAMGGIIKEAFPKVGLTVTGMETYPTGATDFSAGLLKVKETGAQVLFHWIDMPQGLILAKQWHDMKIPAFPFGYLTGVQPPKMWEETAGAVAYTGSFMLCGGNVPSKPEFMGVYNKYTQRWGEEPDSYPVMSYESIYILADAIERAGSLEAEALIPALEKTDHMGVYGRMRFDEKHEVIFGPDPKQAAVTGWFQWQDGKRVQVWPPLAALSEFKLPPWVKPAK